MPPVVALEELAELAASYSAAHERSRASRPSQAAAREADAALILSAIDLASVAIDAVAELAAVAQHPQLSAALSKAAIVAVAVLSERELASAQSGAPYPPPHPSALGHRSRSTHSPQRGRRAWHTRRPCRMIDT